MSSRTEHDLLGDETLPDTAWYGIQTLRALRNFNITGVPIHHFQDLINTLTMVKQASAEANHELGLLNSKKNDAIRQACMRIREGELHNQFVVDLIQGGAGQSTNMNANEVIANLALTIMGHEKGEYQYLHPNNDINKSQSTYDAYPTAARLAVVLSTQTLSHALRSIKSSFEKKAEAFSGILKVGMTSTQDHTPVILGESFQAFAQMLEDEIQHIETACIQLCKVNLGSTVNISSMSEHKSYSTLVISHLALISSLPVTFSSQPMEPDADIKALLAISEIQKHLAVKLSSICNDLCLLSSNQRNGFNEINLPAAQAGSSIASDTTTAVIPEAVNQTAFQVMGHSLTVCIAAQAGNLQHNAMEPVIIYNILNSMKMLSSAIYMLDHRCIRGVTANNSEMMTAQMPHRHLPTAEQALKDKLLDATSLSRFTSTAVTPSMKTAV
ncbi:lyase family protein [Neptunomonas qingdaonensis]|uniref:Aspartate ammonia-lyase n=1 Tax=Neptunomonas qingdaonensis TaxID=1045558 RepID=A0A1I2TYU2_9GAMM|nr:lyase family protein [Neptunomonas qingdaonensis]SFG69359.1 aspartate ammonia-lyase [Neptunomonas qingdaonensis]